MSELPPGVEPAEPPTPRDSSSGIVLRGVEHGREVLLGVRSRQSRFMPGHLAFPGGAVDKGDGSGDAAYRCCLIREMREETGLAIPGERWTAAGERVTPALFPVRFRTRFFLTELPPGTPTPAPASPEIEELTFASPRDVLAEWRGGRARIPPPVLPLLRTLERHEAAPLSEIAAAISSANEREETEPRIEFVPDIWVAPSRTATLPPATHTNTWIPGGRRFAVIDPAAEDEELARLARVLARRMESGSRPHVVLLTHHHHDHVGGAAEIARSLGVPLRAAAATLDLLGLSGDAIADEEIIDLDGMTLQALSTPGHAPGHLAFHVAERRTLIAGDLLSGMSTILIDPRQGDMGTYLSSLRRVLELDVGTLLPGHGPPLPRRALAKLLKHRREREERVVAQLAREPRSLSQVARGAYRDVPEMPRVLVEAQTLAHLLHLEGERRVRRDDEAGTLWSEG